jgi:hypothetical protein
MLRITPQLIVKWAVGCNVRASGNDPTPPLPWAPGGQMRLLRVAVQAARTLDLFGMLGDWGLYLESVTALAINVGHGVFEGAAAETGCDLAFCALAHAGFRWRPGGGPAADFTAAIRQRARAKAQEWLRLSYRLPQADSAALMTAP